MINLTIDGKKIQVEKGTTVLNAARQLNIDIPTLCDHPELTPYGGCRMCLVEVEGARTLQPSCTMPAADGMIVSTDTEKVHDARKFVLSMIFSERNHFCPYCQVSGGDCELQNSAYDEGMTHWPIQPNWQPYPVDASHPFIILENNRCILCRRCVRACGELVGNFTLGFEERGADSTLVADLGLPLGESSCIGCGTCVQVCPTGSLIDRWSAYQGKETEVEITKTVCMGCSLGCGIDVLTRDNRLVRIEGDWDAEINNGVICEVGRFHPMTEDRERLLTPMVKVDGKLKASTWEDAAKKAAAILQASKGNISGVASTRMSMEALARFKDICESVDTKSLLTTEDCQAVSAIYAEAGNGGKVFEANINDLKSAECYLVVGEDITKDHQVLSFFAKRRLPEGATLIQVADEKTGLDNFATISLVVKKDLQAGFLADLAALIYSDKGASEIAETYQLDEALLAQAIKLLVDSKNTAVIFGTRDEIMEANAFVQALSNLSSTLNAKFVSTKGNINSVGAAAIGFDAAGEAEGTVNLLALADEDLSQCTEKRLEASQASIIFSSYVSTLTASADVVFPVQNWLEQSGHVINIDGQILESSAALEAPANVLSNIEAIEKLAAELNITVSTDWEKEAKKAASPVAIR